MKKLANICKYYYYKLYKKNLDKKIKNAGGTRAFFCKHTYAGKIVLSGEEFVEYIKNELSSNRPFLVGRFGASEQNCMVMDEFDISSKKEKSVKQLCEWSGFFPNSVELLEQYCTVQKEAIEEIDVLAVWGTLAEEYFIKKYAPECKMVGLRCLEPWAGDSAWTAMLEGKKVLVVHPFSETIKKQYQVREKLFEGTDILPKFELQVYQAVQTIGGTVDSRFSTWFEALDYMTKEISEMEFDIALVGCGAYGLPLAARIKKMQKQVVHMGGALQLLFGIRGERWDESFPVGKYYNSWWTRPSMEETPENMSIVEGGCYW